MARTCDACGRNVVPKRAEGAETACPECGAAMPPAAAPRRSVRAGAHGVDAGEVFAKSFQVWSANFVPFFAIAFVVLLPVLLLGTAEILGVLGGGSGLLSTTRSILGNLLPILVSAAVISGVFRHLRGSSVTLGGIFASGLARILPALWTGILAGVLTLLPMVPGYLLLAMSLGSRSGPGSAAFGGILTILGVVGTIMISCMLYVAVSASVVEKCNGWPAIKRSLALTKGSRGQIFVILLALGILTFAINFGIGKAAPPNVAAFLRLLVSVLSASFTAVFAGVVYYNLRASKEGIGIEELASVFD